MPGVFRPYTLVDVLGTLNQQSGVLTGSQIITGFGNFAETDEEMTIGDTMSTIVQTNSVWDAGVWGAFTWG